MQNHVTNVNRRWIHKTFKTASRKGEYFIGSSPRSVALSIVVAHDMHPSFCRKLEELIAALIEEGLYVISGGRLVRSEDVTPLVTDESMRHINHQNIRRSRRQFRQRKRFVKSLNVVA